MKKLTEAFNKAVVVKGEIFAIELDSNGSTGYSWDLKLKAGKATFLRQDYFSDAPPDSMTFGGGGKSVYVYKAEEAGVIEITAEYKRVWEKNPPLKSLNFKVTCNKSAFNF
jgi:inhibitor of cysteine peptidase